MVFGLVLYTLTVVAVGGQIALKDYIGDIGCKVYTLTFMAIMGWFVFGGFGVAIFRIMCLRDQTMTNMMRTSIVQKIQKLQILLLNHQSLSIALHDDVIQKVGSHGHVPGMY